MLSLEQCRRIDPDLASVPDEEIQAALGQLYEMAELAFEVWSSEKAAVPNSHLGSAKQQFSS